jgi:hypothetical protein
MSSVRPAEEDRLPWLEPYRETIAQKQRVARRSRGTLAAVVTALILLPAGIGAGFWLGQRSEAPVASRPQPSATVALPPARPVEIAEASTHAAVAPAEPVATDSPPPGTADAGSPPPPAKAEAARPVKRAARPPRRKVRSAAQKSNLSSVRAAQERQARSRAWPKMPSPGPAGQVIQLGAFSTATRASNAYSTRIARYPMLARMPRVIVPVVTKPDGRILYVLRLGTTSRQQSKTVCRNLRASGDHCLVIG